MPPIAARRLLHPPNPDQAVAALDREVEVAEENREGAHLDRDFHRFPRPGVLDIRIIAVQLPPYLAVVENEDGSAAQGSRQLDHGCGDLSDFGRRLGFSEIFLPRHALGRGKPEPAPAGRLGCRTSPSRNSACSSRAPAPKVRTLGAFPGPPGPVGRLHRLRAAPPHRSTSSVRRSPRCRRISRSRPMRLPRRRRAPRRQRRPK